MSSFHLALLRGINVGGKNIVPMKELAKLFADAGCTDVATYIQSGNVVFRAPASVAKTIPAKLAAAIHAKFGLTVPVITRTAPEILATTTNNPFLAGADPALLHVAFLAVQPAAAAIAKLDPNRSPPDRFAVVGKDVYLCLSNGAGGTKLTNAYLDRTLSTVSTMRNWRSVLKLAELAAG